MGFLLLICLTMIVVISIIIVTLKSTPYLSRRTLELYRKGKKDGNIAYKDLNFKSEWMDYRMGDMLKSTFWRDKEAGEKLHLEKFPKSIASRYMLATNKTNDLDVLKTIIKDMPLKIFQLDNMKNKFNIKNTVAIHLRLGDVIDKSNMHIFDFLEKGTDYVRPVEHYKKIISKLKSTRYRNVVLIAGSHNSYKNHRKSFEYLMTIRELFLENGFTVFLKIGGNPDKDFLISVSTPILVVSGGGFSALMGDMSKKLGNQVLR